MSIKVLYLPKNFYTSPIQISGYALVSMLYTARDMLIQVFENNDGRPPSTSRSSKVIDFGANRKPICNFL